MNEQTPLPDESDERIPPVRIHETENYITAIIGGDPASAEDMTGFSGFMKLLPASQSEPLVKEQMITILKETPDAAKFLLGAIGSTENVSYRKELLAFCWEAAVDMTGHIGYFATLAAASNDPFILLEVQTIVQDMDLSDNISRKAALEILVRSLPQKDEIAREILNDLVAFLESRD
jgi:hypothetical protein